MVILGAFLVDLKKKKKHRLFYAFNGSQLLSDYMIIWMFILVTPTIFLKHPTSQAVALLLPKYEKRLTVWCFHPH